jgi:hypothetical protein
LLAFCFAQRAFCAIEIAFRAFADILRRFLPPTIMMSLGGLRPYRSSWASSNPCDRGFHGLATSPAGNGSIMAKPAQKFRRLVTQLRQVLDNRLTLANPAFSLGSSMTEHLAQIFGEAFNLTFRRCDVAWCLSHLASAMKNDNVVWLEIDFATGSDFSAPELRESIAKPLT